MKRYISLLLLFYASSVFAQGMPIWNGNITLPTPFMNGLVGWDANNKSLAYSSGGVWVDIGSSGGGNPAGSAGNLQTNASPTAFGAYAGTSCTNQFPRSLNASGVATCNAVTTTDTDTTIAKTGADINTSNQVTATHLAAALPSGQGGLGVQNPTAHTVPIAEGSSAVNLVSMGAAAVLFGVLNADPIPLVTPTCGDSTHAIGFNPSLMPGSSPFYCQAITVTAAAGGANGAIQYNNAGTIAGLGTISQSSLVIQNSAAAPTAYAGSGPLASHNFATQISATGVLTGAQPQAADIGATSGTFTGAFTFASPPTMSGANLTSATVPSAAIAPGTLTGAFTFGTAPTMSGANISATTVPTTALADGPCMKAMTATTVMASYGGL